MKRRDWIAIALTPLLMPLGPAWIFNLLILPSWTLRTKLLAIVGAVVLILLIPGTPILIMYYSELFSIDILSNLISIDACNFNNIYDIYDCKLHWIIPYVAVLFLATIYTLFRVEIGVKGWKIWATALLIIFTFPLIYYLFLSLLFLPL